MYPRSLWASLTVAQHANKEQTIKQPLRTANASRERRDAGLLLSDADSEKLRLTCCLLGLEQTIGLSDG